MYTLMMLKEIFTQSDEEAIHSLMFDVRYQYALHTTSFEEQPISKNSLTNLRTAVYRYNEEHGVDLIQEEIESHAKEFTKLLNIDGRTARMDSLMISSFCKRLSRLEIIYSCVSRLVEEIQKVGVIPLQEKYKPYLEEGHRNEIIYRSKDKDIIDKLGKQGETTKILVDGAYYSENISKKATSNNIELIPTNLVGRSASSEKTGYEKFKIGEVIHTVKNCPIGHVPGDSKYKRGVYRAHFLKECCDNCPNRSNCPVTKQKKQYLLEVSETKLHCAVLRSKMGITEYQNIATKRAGVEGIPSILRRQYDIDNLPIRGKVRSKVWLGLKIGAINCKRYIKSRILSTSEALFSTLYNHLLEVFSFQRAVAANFAAWA